MTLTFAIISRVTLWLKYPVVPANASKVDIKMFPAAGSNIGPWDTIDGTAFFSDLWQVYNWLVSARDDQ